MTLRTSLSLLLPLVLLAGCQTPSPAGLAKRVSRSAARVVAPEVPPQAADAAPRAQAPVTARALVATSGTGTLSGLVQLERITHPFFADSAASYRALAMPSGHALITLSTLDEALLGKGGAAIRTTAGPDGRFTLAGQVPGDRAFVANAHLAAGHRLSALVGAGANTVVLDEATTMVAEMARWQLADEPANDGRGNLQELAASTITSLEADTRELLALVDFGATGAVPAVDPLKGGNGVTLRNLYVQTFGTRINRAGSSVSDGLSDAWAGVLGYRPVAIAQMPTPGYTQLNSNDIVADHRGNLFLASGGQVLYFANFSRGPLWARTSPMTPGAFYRIAGDPALANDFASRYEPSEASSVVDPTAAPDVTTGFPLPTAQKLLLERVGTTDESHLFFTDRNHHRVMLIPGADFRRFGRDFKAGRLYTVGGTGTYESWGPVVQNDDPSTPNLDETAQAYMIGDDGPAHRAPIVYPQGLARDSAGNLYVADSGYVGVPYANPQAGATTTEPYTNPNAAPGALTMHVFHKSIRLIRAIDGKIFTLKLTRDGAPIAVSAQDVRVRESDAGKYLYVTDTFAHQVFRVRLPDDLTSLEAAIPETFEIEPVLGVPGEAGYVEAGTRLPDLTSVGLGLPRAAMRLNFPLSVDFDAEGNLLVADYYRIHLIKAADLAALDDTTRVYTLAGAFDTGYFEGDSRFVRVRPRYLHYDAYRRNVFFPDSVRNRLFIMWTARGAI